MRHANPVIGNTFANRWQVTDMLGEGSMSTVYKAMDVKTQSVVVLKILHQHLVMKAKNIKRLSERAKALINLQHKHIAQIIDIQMAYDSEINFLVAEYLTGESLEDVLSKTGHLSLERVVAIFSQACEALDYAHQSEIIHGDLKPSNIILLKDTLQEDKVKLLDFGIGRLLSDEIEDHRSDFYITFAKEVFGSPMYISPEQYMNKKLDIRSDIYSLGCLMYETICGKPPFVGKNVLETAYKHMNEAPKALATEPDRALTRLESIIFKCLKKDPILRYQYASDIKHDLDLVLVVMDNQWNSKAFALKKYTKVRAKEKSKLPVSSKRAFTMAAAVISSLLATIFLWLFLDFGKRHYPVFDNGLLWVITNKKSTSEFRNHTDFSNQEKAAISTLGQIEKDKGTNNQEYVEAFYNLIRLYLKAGRWEDASLNLTKLAETAAKSTSRLKPASIYSDLALSHFMQNNFREAKQYSLRAVDLAKKEGSNGLRTLVTCHRILGDIYSRNGDLDQAQNSYEQLIGIIEPYKSTHPGDFSLEASKLADIYRRQHRLIQAEHLYKSALNCYQNSIRRDTSYLAKTLYGLGLVLKQEKKFKDAEQTFKDALPIAKECLGEQSTLVGAIKTEYQSVLWQTNFLKALMYKIGWDKS